MNQDDKNGVYLYCEWVENGHYKSGYKSFTRSEYERLVKSEQSDLVNAEDFIVYPKLGIKDIFIKN